MCLREEPRYGGFGDGMLWAKEVLFPYDKISEFVSGVWLKPKCGSLRPSPLSLKIKNEVMDKNS